MIYVGADHGGFQLKEKVKHWLLENGYVCEDLGNTAYDAEDDYPRYAFTVAEKVASEGEEARGILACRSAAGVIIAANKVNSVRAVAVTTVEMTKHAREHNDANIIALSGDWLTDADAMQIVETFLTTPFSAEERHARRLKQIAAYENLHGRTS